MGKNIRQCKILSALARCFVLPHMSPDTAKFVYLHIFSILQGRPNNPNSASSRTGCQAKIRLLRISDHSWYVSTINDTHNHRLTTACGENKQWGSHGQLDPITKNFIKKLRENNVSLGRICNVLGVAGSCMRKQAVRSMYSHLVQQNMIDDIGKTMNLLTSMKSKDPGLEVKFQLDRKGTLTSMLWCTGRNKYDYSRFGDVMTFDTTYRTNLYSLPFGLFVGINNHFQSIIFGGVLLTTEKTEDFECAFETFLQIMDGKAPKTILTGIILMNIPYFTKNSMFLLYNPLHYKNLLLCHTWPAMITAHYQQRLLMPTHQLHHHMITIFHALHQYLM